jgi:hypothetical protein
VNRAEQSRAEVSRGRRGRREVEKKRRAEVSRGEQSRDEQR